MKKIEFDDEKKDFFLLWTSPFPHNILGFFFFFLFLFLFVIFSAPRALGLFTAAISITRKYQTSDFPFQFIECVSMCALFSVVVIFNSMGKDITNNLDIAT